MSEKRLLTETEKQIVKAQQLGPDGSLRCFISGEIIGPEDVIEYDHIQAFSKDGETNVANIRIAIQKYNRRKGDQTLYDVRDNLRLERLFEAKKNDIRLQDIFDLKEVKRQTIHATSTASVAKLDDGQMTREFPLFHDAILDVPYFYGRIPIAWIENDDQEGLQPRVIDYKRLIAIRDHLKSHPQLAPSIGRLLGGRLKLFDGQHKLAAQVLNNQAEVDIKVYVSPDEPEASKKLFDSLMITNLDAHSNLSPVSYALTKADSENLDWVLVLQGDRLRLYPTKMGVGVGRRGRTETYVELQTSLLADDHLGYLSLIFSAEALKPGGTVDSLLDDSKRFASSLADRLRDRIYTSVMPRLAQGVAAARNLKNPTADDLDLTYRMALTVLFRLLFVAYAEDRDLLPYKHSEAYRVRSLKRKAQELADAPAPYEVAPGARHWEEVERIWNAVARGDKELAVPAYNGGLFTSDRTVSVAGAQLATLKLPNSVFEPALRDLLLTDVGDGVLQPVDFRALGVREFGTIYEGLLESELSVADQDLAVDNRGSYVPVRGRAEPVVRKDEIYLHDRSGARKASGSYFTKSFAVEHLLDRALTPALADHLGRVEGLDEAWKRDAVLAHSLHPCSRDRLTAQAFLPLFREGQGETAIGVNASMAAVLNPDPGANALYPASKFGTLGMGVALRAELAPEGIGVTLFCPGLLSTDIWDAARARPERLGGVRRMDPALAGQWKSAEKPDRVVGLALETMAAGGGWCVAPSSGRGHDRIFAHLDAIRDGVHPEG